MRKKTPLERDIDHSAGGCDFSSPVNRLSAIIELLLPATVKADLVPRHDAPTLPNQ
jgi:hypothetical protein